MANLYTFTWAMLEGWVSKIPGEGDCLGLCASRMFKQEHPDEAQRLVRRSAMGYLFHET